MAFAMLHLGYLVFNCFYRSS